MSGPKSKVNGSKLKYKHAIMLAKMSQPYIREFYELRQQSDDDDQAFGMVIVEKLLFQATDDMSELLCSIMGVSREELDELEFDVLVEWFDKTWEANNLPGFIERVQGLMKNNSQSQLQNLSNASTVGETQNSKS